MIDTWWIAFFHSLVSNRWRKMCNENENNGYMTQKVKEKPSLSMTVWPIYKLNVQIEIFQVICANLSTARSVNCVYWKTPSQRYAYQKQCSIKIGKTKGAFCCCCCWKDTNLNIAAIHLWIFFLAFFVANRVQQWRNNFGVVTKSNENRRLKWLQWESKVFRWNLLNWRLLWQHKRQVSLNCENKNTWTSSIILKLENFKEMSNLPKHETVICVRCW